jgi:hypothetical protein
VKSKQIMRHLKVVAEAGVSAGPVLVGLLEKRYPKYGLLGRQALEMVEAFREEGRGNIKSPPAVGEYYPSLPPNRDDFPLEYQPDPRVQKDALGDALREIQERERLLRAEATARNGLDASR